MIISNTRINWFVKFLKSILKLNMEEAVDQYWLVNANFAWQTNISRSTYTAEPLPSYRSS